jgi:hypothetical protein
MTMNIRYKLTTQNLTTYCGCQWTLNEWKETSGDGELCSSGWLHCYTNPLLAILLNPIHGYIENPRLFEIEVDGKFLTDNGLKEGWTRMRLVKELEISEISDVQRIAFAILCAKKICKEENWNGWANKWLNGEDRTRNSAYFAYSKSRDDSAFQSYAAYAIYTASYAAYAPASRDIACFAADSVKNAVINKCLKLDLIKLAEEAIKVK